MREGLLEFINRGAELAYFKGLLDPAAANPVFAIVRAPSGFGKSSLIDRVRSELEAPQRRFCVVDPSIRATPGGTRLYDGFFLQKCAEQLSTLAAEGQTPWPSLAQFLKQRRWKTAAEKSAGDLVSELPSFESAYKVALDYAARLLGVGQHSPKALLQSDQAHAVAVCAEYARYVLDTFALVLVLREAQHCDLDSLRRLLSIQQVGPGAAIVLEYTTETGQFAPEHAKLLLNSTMTLGGFEILDLVKLESVHLQRLLHDNIDGTFALQTEAYLSWDGNLRSIVELKFRVGIGQKAIGPSTIAGVLENVERGISDHIRSLDPLERMVLACVLAHVEAIDSHVLQQVVAGLDATLRPGLFVQAIDNLLHMHGFLTRTGGALRIHDETITLAAQGIPSFRSATALAEVALRDWYRDLILAGDYRSVGMPMAVRQLFRLCARTRDVVGLLRASEALLVEVRQAQDQLVYVDAVSTAISADPELFGEDHDGLIVWAADLAYGVSDWGRVVDLLSRKTAQDSFCQIMRACAMQEVGRHAEALRLAQAVADQAVHSDERLAAELVSILVVGCTGGYGEARMRLERLIVDPDHQNSPLLGYAFRFFEVVDGFVDALPRLQQSIAWFDRFGFIKSRAYSQLPAAMYLARLGDVEGARTMLDQAERDLAGEVRDHHTVLNNRAAVELLAESPDATLCIALLSAALTNARDDFSELTIITNLAIAHFCRVDLEAAKACAEKALLILERHDFADQDTYWPVCFNAAQIFAAAGESERASEILAFPTMDGHAPSVNGDYWAFRYGVTATVPPAYAFLTSRPWHPLYLSHWVIDLEGLDLLRRARLQ